MTGGSALKAAPGALDAALDVPMSGAGFDQTEDDATPGNKMEQLAILPSPSIAVALERARSATRFASCQLRGLETVPTDFH